MQIKAFIRRDFIPQEQSIKKPFFAGLGSLMVGIFFLAFFWPSLPPEVPLFFSKPWGEAQLVGNYYLALPLSIGLALLFINSTFSQNLDDYPLIRKLLVFGASVVCILASISVIRIILLVI